MACWCRARLRRRAPTEAGTSRSSLPGVMPAAPGGLGGSAIPRGRPPADSMTHGSWKERKAPAPALRPIYQAPKDAPQPRRRTLSRRVRGVRSIQRSCVAGAPAGGDHAAGALPIAGIAPVDGPRKSLRVPVNGNYQATAKRGRQAPPWRDTTGPIESGQNGPDT